MEKNENKFASTSINLIEKVQKPQFSLLKTIITFTASAGGSAFMALPKAYSYYGIIFGVIVQFIGLLNGIISSKLLSSFIVKHKSAKFYHELVEKVLGKRAKTFVNVMFMTNLFGMLVANIIISNGIFSNLLGPTVAKYAGKDINDPEFKSVFNVLIYVILTLLMFPFVIAKDSSMFSKLGVLTIITIVYMTFIVCFQQNEYSETYNSPSSVELWSFDSPIMLIQNYGVYNFLCYAYDGLFMIKADMGKKYITEKNIMALNVSVLFLTILPYTVVGILAYLSLGIDCRNVDLWQNRPLINQNDTDYMMDIARVFLAITVMIAYCSRFIAIKQQLFSTFGKNINSKISN